MLLICFLKGGITGPLVAFIFPGAIYTKLMPRTAPLWVSAQLLQGFGIIVATICPAVTIYSIVTSTD